MKKQFLVFAVFVILLSIISSCSQIEGGGPQYTVKHYQQNIYDDGYTLVTEDTQILTGKSGTLTAAAAKTYAGFEAPANIQQEIIAPDNSTVIELYYTRKSYLVTYELNGGSWVQGYEPPETLRYGALPEAGKLSKTGYTFGKWTGRNRADASLLTGITGEMTLFAMWYAAMNTPYTVEHYKQNASGSGYTLVSADTETKTGMTGSQTAAEGKSYEDFVQNDISQLPIAADGSTVVKIYYDQIHVNPFAVGDIAMSNGIFLRPSAYSSYTGSAVPVGVVCKVYSDGESGVLLGIHNSTASGDAGKFCWAPEDTTGFNTRFWDIIGRVSLYNNQYPEDKDGSNNWDVICAEDPEGILDTETNYPAFNYALNYAENTGLTGTLYETGWYIPTEYEFGYIDDNMDALNSTLEAVGGTVVNNTMTFWTSSQYSETNNAFIVQPRTTCGYIKKNYAFHVLCMRKF